MRILFLFSLLVLCMTAGFAQPLKIDYLTSGGELKDARSGAQMNGILFFLCADRLIAISPLEKQPYQVGETTFGAQVAMTEDLSSDASYKVTIGTGHGLYAISSKGRFAGVLV